MEMTVKDDRKWLIVVTYRPVTNANPCRWLAKPAHGHGPRAYAAHPSSSAEHLEGSDREHDGRTIAVKRLIEKVQEGMLAPNLKPVVSYLGYREDTGEHIYGVDRLSL